MSNHMTLLLIAKVRDMIAAEINREISRAAWVEVDGTDPLASVTYNVEMVLRDHHDYPSADRCATLDMNGML